MTAQAPYESLPPLPEGVKILSRLQSGTETVYTAEQMRAYALAALAALPERAPVSADDGVRVATPEEEAEIDRAAGLYKMTVRIPIAMADRLRDEALAADLVLPAYVRQLLAVLPERAPVSAAGRMNELRALIEKWRAELADLRKCGPDEYLDGRMYELETHADELAALLDSGDCVVVPREAEAEPFYYVTKTAHGWVIYAMREGPRCWIYNFGHGESAEITANGVCAELLKERAAMIAAATKEQSE